MPENQLGGGPTLAFLLGGPWPRTPAFLASALSLLRPMYIPTGAHGFATCLEQAAWNSSWAACPQAGVWATGWPPFTRSSWMLSETRRPFRPPS